MSQAESAVQRFMKPRSSSKQFVFIDSVLVQKGEAPHQVCFHTLLQRTEPRVFPHFGVQRYAVQRADKVLLRVPGSAAQVADELDVTFPSWKSERGPPSPAERSPMKTSASPVQRRGSPQMKTISFQECNKL